MSIAVIQFWIAFMVRGGSELGVDALAHSLARVVWGGGGWLWCAACCFGLAFPLANVVKLLAY